VAVAARSASVNPGYSLASVAYVVIAGTVIVFALVPLTSSHR